LKNRKFPF